MRLRLALHFFLLGIWTAGFVHGQDTTVVDSLPSETIDIQERLAEERRQQRQIDSLIRVHLESELEKVSDDQDKARELEEKIRQIKVSDSLRKVEQQQYVEALKKNSTGFPVSPFADTLFNIHAKIGSFKAEERAAAIEKRIRKLYDDPFFKADSLAIVSTNDGFDIMYDRNMVVMSITSIDALWLNRSPEELANEYLDIIKTEILDRKKANSVKNILKKIGLILIILFGLFLMIRLINFLFKKIKAVIHKNRDKIFTGFLFHKFQVFSPGQFVLVLFKVLNVFRIAVILIGIYLSLPLIFSVFPETKAITNTLLGWILNPAQNALLSIWRFLPNLFTIVVIFLLFRYGIRSIHYLFTEVERGRLQVSGFHPDWAKPTFNILRFILYAFMLVIIFPYLPGSESPAFRGVSVFLGVLLSLGSTSAIANMVAGLVITYMRPFQIGDRVKIGEVTGDVLEKTSLVTRIRTIKNEDVTVPNSIVLSSNTINYSTNTTAEDKGLILHTTVTIGYDVPWKKMQEALLEAARRTPDLQDEPPPFVLQTSLDDFYISYQVNAYTKHPRRQAQIYSDLHQHILDCCDEAGIEILSPHFRQLRQDDGMTDPKKRLSREEDKEESE